MKIKTLTVGLLHTNCYILFDEPSGKCAVIDPGAAAENILAAIDGFKVEYILLTHGHFDHILAAPRISRETGGKIYYHRADERFVHEKYVKRTGCVREEYDTPKPFGYLEEGMELPLGTLALKIISTPGHSEGSCVIMCGDVMFSGDTLFCESWGRCDLEGGSEEEMMNSLARLYALDGDYKILPGHEESTTLSHERACNQLMKYAVTK